MISAAVEVRARMGLAKANVELQIVRADDIDAAAVYQIGDPAKILVADVTLQDPLQAVVALAHDVHGQRPDQLLDARQLNAHPELNIVVADGFPETWFVGSDRIGQVIRNLLENAVFACGDSGKIEVRLSMVGRKNDRVRIEVCDDGDGIATDQREQIFAPFFTTKTKGTGLGLAICSRIANSHNGRLYAADSELGGAKFVLELPEGTKGEKAAK